jgi:hypothetical protein
VEGKGIVITGGARSLDLATERAFGVPLDQVHADRMPAPPRRAAAVA